MQGAVRGGLHAAAAVRRLAARLVFDGFLSVSGF